MMCVHVVGKLDRSLLPLDIACSVTASAHRHECESELIQANICIYCLDRHSPDELLAVRRIKIKHPGLSVIVVATIDSGHTVRMALRCKARDFVLLPDEAEYLQHLLVKIGDQIACRTALPETQGREVDFLSDMPGAGLRQSIQLYKNRARTAAAIEYITQHYALEIEVPKLARLCAVSVSVFTCVFRSEHGCTASEYITRFRMEIAMSLLRDTGSMIKVIAFKVGYADDAYFIRAFKKFIGVAPLAYRLSAD